MKSVAAGTVALAVALVSCSGPGSVPPAAARPAPGPDPCALISPSQAAQLRLNAPHRSDSPGEYTACSWSTQYGSAVSVGLEERAHTVQQYVARETPATTTPWTGERHHGATLDWHDGHRIGIVIALGPDRIATVGIYSSDPDRELGRPVTRTLRETAEVVDRTLPA